MVQVRRLYKEHIKERHHYHPQPLFSGSLCHPSDNRRAIIVYVDAAIKGTRRKHMSIPVKEQIYLLLAFN